MNIKLLYQLTQYISDTDLIERQNDTTDLYNKLCVTYYERDFSAILISGFIILTDISTFIKGNNQQPKFQTI